MGQTPGQESWGLLDTVLAEMATVVSKEKNSGTERVQGYQRA